MVLGGLLLVHEAFGCRTYILSSLSYRTLQEMLRTNVPNACCSVDGDLWREGIVCLCV